MYVRDFSLGGWKDEQASTQYQGQGSSHELASLLLTETILYSRYTNKMPLFALFLDAKSAFDRVVKEILVRNLFFSGTDDQRLIYLNNRLSNRRTFCEFNNELMGPISDTRGLEQGGVSSSEAYKLYNNEQAKNSQSSGLGASLGFSTISCISLADDAVLLSNNIYDLRNLLHLTVHYCNKYQVKLVPDKSHFLAFGVPDHEVNLIDSSCLISLDGKTILHSSQAVHLGVLRSVGSSNMPMILDRISSHKKKQMFSLLPSGMALKHYGSPAASLCVQKVYCLPVLLSGLASLVLTKNEIKTLESYYKTTLIKLMKLRDKTPDPAVYFLAGSLPLEGMLHLRQLSLFSMVCHLPNDMINVHAKRVLLIQSSSARTWFHAVRDICDRYELPHPLDLLHHPPDKDRFKNLCKLNIQEYWRRKLSVEADGLQSLRFLDTRFLSLSSPHRIWQSLDGNPYQAQAASVQALLLSGRYRTERLCRYWSANNNGYCLLGQCSDLKIIENIEHFLLKCDALNDERRRLYENSLNVRVQYPILQPVLDAYLLTNDDNLKLKFLLDCSSLPMVISASQLLGDNVYSILFKLTRTWCRSLHRARLRKLVRWKPVRQ